MDGLEVCKQLRANAETRNAIIILLTAKTEETDQLIGFSVGADDYVVKPFSIRVLVERIKALQRRRSEQAEASEEMVEGHGISVDRRRHVVTVNNEQMDLTKSEFGLLSTLIRQPGRVFDRAELIDAALGGDVLVQDRTIDVHIRALRKKLGDAAEVIETVRGIGYRFKEV
jgi:two-component system phosphate regulon response regulator PhoB